MKRKMKMTISALSVMLVMALAVTIVSFSLAGNNDESEALDEQLLYAAEDKPLTIIDRIILNSIEEGEDTYYKIVEIGSKKEPDYTTLADGTEVSYMGALANGSESDFKKYVIDSHKSDAAEVSDKLMKADKIKYKYYYVSDVTEDNLEDISSADLIYVSNDPTNPYVAGTNDFSEELYSAILHTYTSNRKKPLIIDSPIDTADIGGGGGSQPDPTESVTTMGTLAHDVFDVKGRRYYTFEWNTDPDNGQTADEFFKHEKNSKYFGINGSRKKENWVSLKDPDKPTDRVNTSRMLIISPNAKTSTDSTRPITKADYPMAYDLLGLTDGDATFSLDDDEGKSIPVYGIATYPGRQNRMYDYGYNAKYSRPTAMIVDTYQLQAGDTELLNFDFAKYDMIVIEDGLEDVQITPELYRKFTAAMIGNVSIVYNSKMNKDTSSGGSGSDNDSDSDSFDPTLSNYNKLFSMIASSKGESLMSNVMVTNRDDFGVIALSKSAVTCKTIADLINRSAFRTFGGNDSSGTTFTVLEIQPCYPIDRKLAENLGKNDATKRKSVRDIDNNGNYKADAKIIQKYGFDNYYTVPANVVNNVTKEQVPEGQEYYAWEVSDAKIIDAIGTYANVDASNINIVHMSSEELAASTTAILGTYDMIYIGGNISAKKTAEEYQGIDGVAGNTYYKQEFRNIKKLPIYTTYSHNGEMTAVNLGTTGESGGVVKGGTSYATSVTPYGSNGVFAVLNGNDITYNKAQELIKYVNSGMPVIVSDDAALAYETLAKAKEVDGNEYLQNSLDPDSNMRDVLEECYNVKSKKGKNVLWDFEKDATYTTDNDGGRLGSTLTGYVRVYASAEGSTSIAGTDVGNPYADGKGLIKGQKEDITALYNNSVKKPKIVATKIPKIYDDTQKDSALKRNDNGTCDLNFEYEVSGTSGKYSVMFYIDDDGNGRFTTGEEDVHKEFGPTSGTYTLPKEYFGSFAWKLEVTDKLTNAVSSITGVSNVGMSSDEKKTVRVLQIMPGTADNPKGESAQGCNSLYFCTTCQQAYMRLDYNPVANTTELFNLYYRGNYLESNANSVITDGASAGKHEHTFGIVKYDSTINDPWISKAEHWVGESGADDWHYNLADELSDMYDFQLDILTRGEVEAISDQVRAAYNVPEAEKNAKIAAFDEMVADSSDEFKAEVKDYTPDQKLAYMVRSEAAAKASEYWNQYIALRDKSNRDESGKPSTKTYTDPITNQAVTTMTTYDAQAELDGAIDELIKNLSASNETIGGMTGPQIAEELQHIKDEKKYFNYFSIINGGTNVGMYQNDQIAKFLTSTERKNNKYTTYYKDYVKAKDLELSYLEMYKKYDRIAHADNWMKGCYDTVILGPSEDFAGDDFTKDSNGLKDLVNYTKDGGNLLMFHDTFTRFSDAGSANLTDALRPCVGLDKNHMVPDESKMSEKTYYLPYKLAEGYEDEESKNKYFMMNLSSRNTPVGEKDKAWYEGWTQEMDDAVKEDMAFPKKYLTSVAYTDSVLCADMSFNLFASPYRFAELSWSYAAFYFNQAYLDARYVMRDPTMGYGTDRATRNNQGLVTLYPFSLSEKIYVSGTHAQSYALDLEDDDTTVWYSLAGGYNKQKGSSMYAASPNDGMDNYFIYSYKNVFYCGAGHSKVTGVGKNNNDERKLYINIICNSLKPSAKQPQTVDPDIEVYDYKTDDELEKVINDEKDESKNYYVLDVDAASGDLDDTTLEYPEFSFKVVLDKLQSVTVYYDLDFSDATIDDYYGDGTNEKHVLIGKWSVPKVNSGERFDLGRDTIFTDGTDASTVLLRLLSRYFTPYNNEYTYIVIEATDTDGNKYHQRIKVKLKPDLFNLT